MKQQRKLPGLRFILIVGTLLLLLITQLVGFSPNITTPIERLDLLTRDSMFRLRGPQKPSEDIVIVAIDDFSFKWTGFQWPWPRTYLAEIVDQINLGGARVVELDIYFFEPDPTPGGDEALARALGESQNAVSNMQIFKTGDSQWTLSLPIAPYLDVLDGIGIASIQRSEDAIVRELWVAEKYDNQRYFNWAFETARLFLGVEPPTNVSPNGLTFNGQNIPLSQGRMQINYLGPAGTYPTYSAANVADGIVLEENPDVFRDKIVLVGATTDTLQDVHPTSFSSTRTTPGVEIIANAIDTIINNRYLREAAPWSSLLFILLAALIATLITLSKRPGRTIALMAISTLAYAAGVYIVFIRNGLYLPFTGPELMLVLGVILPTLEQAVSQELEKRRVRSMFSRFISPEMVNKLISTQDINSLNKRTNLTILFSDIRGFTTLSEKLPPEEVVALLNPYLEAMTKIIYKYGGTVDKYEGDAILAFYGEPDPYPDHAARAVHTAVEMRTALETLRTQWVQEGRVSEGFEMGVGINSGDVFVGLLGSAQRINYTVIGDNVNLAARIQDLTKKYKWPILISEVTYQQVKEDFVCELVDSVVVKGKTNAVNLYTVRGKKKTPKDKLIQPWKIK